MKKMNKKRMIIPGVICVILMAVSSWYSVTYNDSRLVAPMKFSEYVFQMKDLPMIISGIFLAAYILYLLVLLMTAIMKNKSEEKESAVTREISPKRGLFGFCGFFGFMGFWTYGVNKTVFPFVFFLFFGFFGLFYEGKMSNTFKDERYRENQMKARLTADKIALNIIFAAVLVLGQGGLMGNLEYSLIAIIIIVALSIALNVFLGSYLLYHYDQDEVLDESGE